MQRAWQGHQAIHRASPMNHRNRSVTAQQSPTSIDVHRDAIEIDAAIVADGLGVVASHVPVLIRNGEITSICERGTGQDTGRHRLTFFYRGKRLRVIIDDEGRLIRRSTIDFGGRPLPPLLRRPER